MNKVQALAAFWDSFGWNAFDENSVPEEYPTGVKLVPPYITYQVATDSLNDYGIALTASLWHKSPDTLTKVGWAEVTLKSEEISAAIGRGGKVMPYEGGYLWIKRGSPFAQRMSDPEDDLIRRIVLNIEAEYLSEN